MISLSSRKTLLAMVILLFLACKKEKIINSEDKFTEKTEELSALQATLSSAGQQFVELQWNAVNNSHYKTVHYSVFLDDVKIVEGLTVTKYSLINLTPGKSYNIKIMASTADGMKIEQSLVGKTLEAANSATLYAEYSIHDFSRMTGSTALQKSADGSHVIARYLSHSAYFGGESTKVIVFKVDKDGNMLWYRLLSTEALKTNSMGQLLLALHNGDKEAILLVSGFALKINVTTGEVLSTKDYRTELAGQTFQAARYTTSQELIVGCTNGALLSINPTDLTVNWHRANTNRTGRIVSITTDSKKNIYYIFQDFSDRYTQIRVDKCNSTGNFVTSFLFDGILPNENNWGFWMTALVADAQDNLYLFGHNSDYNYLRYFKFNTDGTVLKKNTTSDNFLPRFAFVNDKGEIVVTGRIDGSSLNTYGTVYVFDKDMNIKSKEIYNTLPYHGIAGLTGNADGSYNIFLHYMQTYSYDNSNFVFIKTGTNGKI